MRKEIIQTGKTEEEAINSACLLLATPREECEWEILERARTSFFGLRKIPAKVRVWKIKEEEEKEAKPVKRKKPAVTKVETVKEEKAEVKKPAKAEVSEKKEKAPAKSVATKQEPVIVAEEKKSELLSDEIVMQKVDLARSYVDEIIKGMDVDAVSEIREEDGGVWISIQGKSLGTLIGRRGDTLDAIQYLTNIVANRIEGDFLRITVDCGDYRLKRNKTLEEMAEKYAKQVLKTDISRTLEPMPPSERRIIHATVSNIEGVSSTSVGNEPYRRVVIKTPTSKNKPDNRRRDNRKPPRKGGGRPPRKSRDDSRQTRDTSEKREPIITPETKAETPLYGKVELD